MNIFLYINLIHYQLDKEIRIDKMILKRHHCRDQVLNLGTDLHITLVFYMHLSGNDSETVCQVLTPPGYHLFFLIGSMTTTTNWVDGCGQEVQSVVFKVLIHQSQDNLKVKGFFFISKHSCAIVISHVYHI